MHFAAVIIITLAAFKVITAQDADTTFLCLRRISDPPQALSVPPTLASSSSNTIVYSVIVNSFDATLLLYARDSITSSWDFESPRYFIPAKCARLVPSLPQQLWAIRLMMQTGQPIILETCGEMAANSVPKLATALEGIDGTNLNDRIAYFYAKAGSSSLIIRLDDNSPDCINGDDNVVVKTPVEVPSYFSLNVDIAEGDNDSNSAVLSITSGTPPSARGDAPPPHTDSGVPIAHVNADFSALLTPLSVIANYSAPHFACPACNYKVEANMTEAEDAARHAAHGLHARLPLIPCHTCRGTGKAVSTSTHGRASFSSESTCPICKGVGAHTLPDTICAACDGERHIKDSTRSFFTLIPAGAPSRLVISPNPNKFDFLTLLLNITSKNVALEGLQMSNWKRECEGMNENSDVSSTNSNFDSFSQSSSVTSSSSSSATATSSSSASAIAAILRAVPLPNSLKNGTCTESNGGGAHIVSNVTVKLRIAASRGVTIPLGNLLPTISVNKSSSLSTFQLNIPAPIFPNDEIIILGAGLPINQGGDDDDDDECSWRHILPPPPLLRDDIAAFFREQCPSRAQQWETISSALTQACDFAKKENDDNGDNDAWLLLRIKSRSFYCIPSVFRRDVTTLFPHGHAILRMHIVLDEDDGALAGASASAALQPGTVAALSDDELTTLVRVLARRNV